MLKTLATYILKSKGWTAVNQPASEIKRCVLLAAPHTTNWDYLYALSFGFFLDLRFRIAIKHFWTTFPFGLLIKPLGGIGIKRGSERDKSVSQVDLIADLFTEHKELTLIVAPEGSRRLTKEWKSGYYHMALKANVHILPVFLDYSRRELTFGDPILPTEDKPGTLKQIMAFYKSKDGKGYDPSKFVVDSRYV